MEENTDKIVKHFDLSAMNFTLEKIKERLKESEEKRYQLEMEIRRTYKDGQEKNNT